MRRYGSKNNYQQQGTKVPVVYYLCRNQHLEHPHFIEVPLSSNEGLYLRDVLNRLNVLRGKRMAAMYSWSCKRSYQNGFVWHDLAENDLILPAQGNEYVLKGSELLDQSPPGRHSHGLSIAKIQHEKHHQQEGSPVLSKPDEASSSSSSPPAIIKEAEKVLSPSKPPTPLQEPIRPRLAFTAREDVSSPSTHRSGSSGEFSAEPIGKTALAITVDSPSKAQGASTQTEDWESRVDVVNTRIVGDSTSKESLHVKFKESDSKYISQPKLVPEIVTLERSPRPSSSSASSSCGRTGTLESLIRDEIRKRNSLRIVEEDFVPTRGKIKATDMLMQLISCGSIAVKDHYGFGFVPTYRPRFNNDKFPSPLVSNSVVSSELSCLSESQGVSGLKEQENVFHWEQGWSK